MEIFLIIMVVVGVYLFKASGRAKELTDRLDYLDSQVVLLRKAGEKLYDQLNNKR